ncbi:hypothetical protein L1987_18655 [Smallanthus sonchifolius]|uniref:Uncharacterized protein n=1 Tax=Smallanthus sonchifolius TaxID=185202 RepID=A0ACB9J2Y2_9ASTR|nr:hypothetical protein L1987_18655 [Smallanthus sonchifolius]
MQFVLSFKDYKIQRKLLRKSTPESYILSAWSVSVLQQKVVSAAMLLISSKTQLSTAADDLPISSNFGLQQIRLSATDLFFSRRTSEQPINNQVSEAETENEVHIVDKSAGVNESDQDKQDGSSLNVNEPVNVSEEV